LRDHLSYHEKVTPGRVTAGPIRLGAINEPGQGLGINPAAALFSRSRCRNGSIAHHASVRVGGCRAGAAGDANPGKKHESRTGSQDRKSTRLNSSHVKISYAV